MADAPKFNIHKRTTKEKPGKYDEEVAALIEVNDPDSVIDILVPTGEIAKHKRYFQDSAKRALRSARIDSTEDQGDGTTILAFALTEKITRPRAVKNDESGDVEVSDAA